MDAEHFPSCLYLNEDLSDVRLIVENELTKWNFPAHSLILKQKSPVFRTMLEGDFNEAKDRTIVITDFKTSHIKQLLKFLYTGTLPEVSYSSLCELLKLSDKYMVAKLARECEKALLEFVTLQNVFELCHLADLCLLDNLRGKCLALIKRAAFKLFKSDELEYLFKETLEEIVKDDQLNVNNEMDVFCAIWKWGNLKIRSEGSEISRKEVENFIKDLLKHVRWSLLKEVDKDHVISLGITVEESLLQKVDQPRAAAASPNGMSEFLVKLCKVLPLDIFASTCTFFENSITDKVARSLLHFVSLSDTPFYIAGLSLACTEPCNTSQYGGEVTCNRGPVSSVATADISTFKSVKIGIVSYQEVMCSFLTPVQVCKNETVRINFKRNDYSISPVGFLVMNFGTSNFTLKDSNKSYFRIEGPIYGITQLYIL